LRVHIDRAVLETPKDERGQATVHLVSMIGGNAEIGALRAFWSTRYIEDVLGFAI